MRDPIDDARTSEMGPVSSIGSCPIYYGWVILGAATLGRIMSSPGQTYTVSIFIDQFVRDLGLSRSAVSALYTIGTLGAGLSLPFIGRQIDRLGPRYLIGFVSVALALTCVYMSFVTNALMLGLGFLLLRMLGQNSLGMVCNNVVNRWWIGRRGTVFGISGVLSSLLGMGSFPLLVNLLIASFGWRLSYAVLGIVVAAVMIPVGIGLFRDQPEDYGLLPDGRKLQTGRATMLDHTTALNGWTRREALHNAAFWIVTIGLGSLSMLNTGLHFHMVSIFADAGLSVEAAAAVFVPISVTGAVIGLTMGPLIDSFSIKYFLCAALLGMAVSLMVAPYLQGQTSALTFGVLLGTVSGLEMLVVSVVYAKYYGRRHLGSISGAASLILIVGSALGPLPIGIARDLLGSYVFGLTAMAAIPLVLGIMVFIVREPASVNRYG